MATQRELRALLATDGSRDAQAAIANTLLFPWPDRTQFGRSVRQDSGGVQTVDSADRAIRPG